MSDIGPEDRERLVKVKFRELFDEAFAEAFDERVAQMREAAKNRQSESSGQQATSAQSQHTPPQRPRRRSLLEESLSQVLGLP